MLPAGWRTELQPQGGGNKSQRGGHTPGKVNPSLLLAPVRALRHLQWALSVRAAELEMNLVSWEQCRKGFDHLESVSLKIVCYNNRFGSFL